MSVAGILASGLLQVGWGHSNKLAELRASEFQKLGQDLQSGNLTQAQTDFATLTQNSASLQGNNLSPLSQAFKALGQALQSGNLTAAQQDFATIQQDLQQVSQSHSLRKHHHHASLQSALAASGAQNSPIAQAFGSLGQALQAGNVSAAQQAYATIQQDLQLFATTTAPGTSSSGSASPPTSSGSLSVKA
jgi:hypothetical protein